MVYTRRMRTNRPADGAFDALRAEVRGSPWARQQHRIHAVLLVARGLSCRGAARLLGDSPRAVEYWVRRYNDNKINGLYGSTPSGRPPRLSAARIAELREITVGAPPNGARGWTGVALRALILRRWGVRLGLRQSQRLLARLKAE